jgi:methyl-accepting chemotaxis protein
MKSGGLSTAAMMMNTVDGEYAKLSKQLDDMVADVTQSSVEHGNVATAANQRAEVVSLVLLLAALVLSMLATTLCVRLIARPLGRAVAVAKQVADGDLRHSLDERGSDATGQVLAALDDVTGRLSGIMVDIRAVAEHIDQASREVAAGNLDLSGRTERAASALQMTASTVEQLTAQMQQNSATASQASRLAGDAVSVARQGGGMVKEVVEAMNDIHHHAQRIGDIIGVIDGIAFQTNILSLNAAVEAARAGEHGRGFAVVASEVRALSGRSSQAAKEIRELIGASVERASAGAGKVEAAGAIMVRIVGSIEELSGMVAQIALANDEQAKGVAGVNQTVVEMDRNTQQNAALVEQASAATMSLQRQSERLLEAVAVFRTN